MKKLLSLLGVVAISASAVSSSILSTRFDTTVYQKQNILESKDSKNDSILQIYQLKNSYENLSESEKIDVSLAMSKLTKLNNISEVAKFLVNSKINFIRENKEVIKNMFLLYTSFKKVTRTLAISTQSLNVEWIKINQFIDLDFGDSNNYTPSISTYGPSKWWKAWEWGWQISFPEGDINVMRVVKLLFSLYNGINFAPLESLIKSGKTFFDYLTHLDQHSNDKIAVLYDLIIKTRNDFKKSNIPFTKDLYQIFDLASELLESSKEIKISRIKNSLKKIIEKVTGKSLEKISQDYSGYLNQTLNILTITNKTLDNIKTTLPGVVWSFIANGIKLISDQMIKADGNHKGVYLKFQQFIIPLGFKGA